MGVVKFPYPRLSERRGLVRLTYASRVAEQKYAADGSSLFNEGAIGKWFGGRELYAASDRLVLEKLASWNLGYPWEYKVVKVEAVHYSQVPKGKMIWHSMFDYEEKE